MTEATEEYRLKVHGAVRTALGTIVAGGAAVAVELAPESWFAGLGVLVAALAAVLATTRMHLDSAEQAAGRATGPRLAALVAAGALALRHVPGPGWSVLVAISLGLAVLAVLGESLARRASRVSRVYAAHLPGFTMPRRRRPPVAALFPASLVVAVSAAPLAWWPGLVGAWCALALASFLLVVATGLTGLWRWRQDKRLEERLVEAVRAYDPEFVVYTSRPDDASYQVAMWLPYLRRTGRRFIVVARSQEAVEGLVPLVPEPVVRRHSAAALETVITPSLGAVFYVNASSGNNQMVRHHKLTHVYLGHGDSDKPPSYNPTHRMYDQVFVAGPAAIERYAAHGVRVDPSRFVVVGRPQVEDVEVVDGPPPAGAERTVLYAPTWRGHVAETALSSLPLGERIVAALLARGVRVIFRPHPFSYDFPEDVVTVERIQRLLEEDAARTGRAHLWGAAAERDRTILECINASDAMVSDVSSVVSDYLYSRKPFAMVAVPAPEPQFSAEYPIARAAYVLDGDLANLEEVLDGLLLADTMAQQRDAVRAHYLGDFPAEDYAQHFVDAVEAAIVRGQRAEAEEDDGPEGDESEGAEVPGEDSEDPLPAFVRGSGLVRAVLGSAAWRRGVLPVLEHLPALVVLTLAAAGLPPAVLAVLAGLATLRQLYLWVRSVRAGRPWGARLGAQSPTVFFLVSALVLGVPEDAPGAVWLLVAAGAASVGGFGVAHLHWQRGVHAANLPGIRVPSRHVPASSGALTGSGLLLAVLATATTAWPALLPVTETVAVLAGVVLVVAFLVAARQALLTVADLAGLRGVLEDLGPRFAVYFAAGASSVYQFAMWEEYFRRIERPFVVVVRTLPALWAISQITTAPVVHRPDLRSLDDVTVPSLRTVFYVNNAVKNTHMIERSHLHHVWLNHGDSEKPACYNPVHAIYDTIFAAGQAAIDRYARHGVHLPREAFEIVGRPQVSVIEPARARAAGERATVLYAPTWIGPYSDTDVYSLPVGADVVRALLARDVRVVFRAHPLNYTKPVGRALVEEIQEILRADAARTGREHLWGEAAERALTVEECFNLSDAMICDVSAVVSDYLQSGKPMAIMAMGHAPEEILEVVPAARAAYVVPRSLEGLEQRLTELLETDPLREARIQMRRYYLGDFPAERYAEGFLEAARRFVDAPPKVS